MIDLKSFISKTIQDIISGVNEAATNIDHTQGIIVPVGGEVRTYANQSVRFDVAITASEVNEGEAGAHLKIAIVSAGGTGTTTTEHSSVSRIQFDVPIAFAAHNSSGHNVNRRS